MDQSSYKSITTIRSYNYSYYVSPTKGSKGSIVLLHGFPEYADMWAEQVKVFESLGYNCIAPDLLGYGATSKPTDAEAYNSEGLSQDVADIMDAENVEKAVFIGHDWGSYLAGRFANWQPARISGLVITSVSYRASGKLDLATSNAQMKAAFGYEPFGYWTWIASPEAPKILDDHLESLFSLLFAKDAEIWKTEFTPTGKLQQWLSENKTAPTADYMDSEAKADLLRKWKADGFDGKLGWYRAMTENTHWEHEQKIAPEAFKLSIPVLFIGGARDAPAPAALGNLATKPLCENYTGTVVDSGHWMLREKPAEWMEAVKPWLLSNF